MQEINFSNEKYKFIAMSLGHSKESNHSFNDAFFLLINGVSFDNLDNLCKLIQNYYSNSINISLEDAYRLTQNNSLDEIEKDIIINLATDCIRSGNSLGSKTINEGKINTSEWINHCYYSSDVCGTLAKNLGIDENTAKTLGLLHDYGRKFDHSFNHTIKGFESLVDLGWYNEATSCLTHSFVNGGRCANNEVAVNGFGLDKDGNAIWKENAEKDDITLFLENYKYSDFDILLNVADLMATSKGIMSPKERIEDIATRRLIDTTNRGYFLAEFTNVLINLLKKLNLIDDNIPYIKDDENTSLEQIQNYFNNVSEYFFKAFQNLQINNVKQKN